MSQVWKDADETALISYSTISERS